MTYTEAIRHIKEHMRIHQIGQYPHIKVGVALLMAIELLEKETKNEQCKS